MLIYIDTLSKIHCNVNMYNEYFMKSYEAYNFRNNIKIYKR